MAILWRCLWWRYLVILVAAHWPRCLGEPLAYHSGLLVALEDLARRLGDFAQVQACREELRRLEVHYGPDKSV